MAVGSIAAAVFGCARERSPAPTIRAQADASALANHTTPLGDARVERPDATPSAEIDSEPAARITFRGRIGEKSDITLSVATATGHVVGVYFYDRVADPIDLEGEHTQDGAFTLTERANGVVTGVLNIDRATGSVRTGTWRAPTKPTTLPVTLTEVPRIKGDSKAILLAKRVKRSVAPDSKTREARGAEGAGGVDPDAVCKVDFRYPVVAGLGSAEGERALNARIVAQLEIGKSPWEEACTLNDSYSFDFEVFHNGDGLLSLCLEAPMAWKKRKPNDVMATGRCSTFDVATGHELSWGDLTGRDRAALFQASLKRVLMEHFDDAHLVDATVYVGGGFTVGPCGLGVRPSVAEYNRALALTLYSVPYGRIAASLDPASPLARVAARAPTPCTDDRVVPLAVR